ncbi:MAG: fimbrillin family protein, partial [Duncaniella sp.]|nr:fimbrillin family protein [Duncaniella sp.]
MIQLHNSHFLRNLVYATSVVLLAMTAGCADDPLLSDRGGASKSPVFDVAIMSSWTDGMKVDRSSDGTRLSIDSIDNQSAGEQLYLITEQAALNDSVSCHATAMSRGSKIESLDKFPESFGLSAICYVGSSPTADYTTEFAHNIEIVKSGTLWEPKSHKMEWPGSGHIRFMAYAPYGHSDLKYSTADKPMLDFTVTTDIKKQIDLLTATVDCSGAGGSAVSLSFGHALSAITIKTGSEMLAGKVSKISISGIHRSGSLDMLTGKWTPKGDSATSFDIEFDPNNDYKENPGKNDTKDDYPYTKPGSNIAGNGDDLTLFMIPQQLGENAALTMEFTDNLTGKQRTLTAKIGGKDKEWKAGNIYAYSLSTTGIVITPVVKLVKHGSTTDEFPFDSIPFSGSIRNVDLTAYVRVQQVGETTPKDLEYPVSIFSSADGGATWEQAVWEPNTPSEYPDYDGTPKSLKAMKTLTGSFHLQPQPVFKEMMSVFSTTEQGPEQGPDKEWIDLSQISGETANCYMVNFPGYYCFPLVYGNGIKNGTDNKSAYTIDRGPDTDTDKAEPGMLFFVDHLRRQITTPYIEDQVGAGNLDDAFILWQDSPGLLDLVEKSTVNGKSCIRFRVSRHSMVQGNAVIALRDKSGKIVWSWHIWVTDCKATDLFTTNSMPIPPETEGTQYRFLTRTLG